MQKTYSKIAITVTIFNIIKKLSGYMHCCLGQETLTDKQLHFDAEIIPFSTRKTCYQGLCCLIVPDKKKVGILKEFQELEVSS